MTESANSLSVSLTPEFLSARYSKPTWKVLVNSIEQADAILEKIELGYGSDMSSATFHLPRTLDSSNQPEDDDAVTVIVNNKIIFNGVIRVITKHLGINGQKITYTCLSNLSKLNNKTVIHGNFSSFVINPQAKSLIKYLLGIPIPGGPSGTTGEIDVTDQTILEAAESILSKVGNDRLYYDMANDSYDIYRLGSGGTNTRSFIFGKNIISYDITRNTESVVDRVIVTGITGDYRQTVPLPIDSLRLVTSQSGKELLSFTLPIGARDISVEGLGNEQPAVQFSNYVKASKKMLHIFTSPANPFIGTYGGFEFKLDLNNDIAINNSGEEDELKSAVIDHHEYKPEWSQIGTEIKTSLFSTTQQIFLTDLPKVWHSHFIKGSVLNREVGIDKDKNGNNLSIDEINTGRTEIEIMDYPEFTWVTGALRVTYTTDLPAPSIQVGTGPVFRSLNDSQYKNIIDKTTGENNTVSISSLMYARAIAEYTKLHLAPVSGNITILGDETVGLKQTVIAENEVLDVLHIIHNFENGFTTTITLTNEKFIPQINYVQAIRTQNKTIDTERDRRRSRLIEHVNSDLLSKLDKQKSGEGKPILQAQKQGTTSFLSK